MNIIFGKFSKESIGEYFFFKRNHFIHGPSAESCAIFGGRGRVFRSVKLTPLMEIVWGQSRSASRFVALALTNFQMATLARVGHLQRGRCPPNQIHLDKALKTLPDDPKNRKHLSGRGAANPPNKVLGGEAVAGFLQFMDKFKEGRPYMEKWLQGNPDALDFTVTEVTAQMLNETK